MNKRIISILLCLSIMLTTAIAFAGCGSALSSRFSSSDPMAQTLVLAMIKDENTTDSAVQAVEEALNEITKAKYNTKVILKMYTPDEYVSKLMEQFDSMWERQSEIESQLVTEDDEKNYVITRYTKEQLEKFQNDPKYEQIPNGDYIYYEQGWKVVTEYPEVPEDQLDVVFINDIETYYQLMQKQYIIELSDDLSENGTLKKYVNDAVLDRVRKVGDWEDAGTMYAIPNNLTSDKCNYLLINKALFDYYKYDIKMDTFVTDSNSGGIDDLSDLLYFFGDVMRDNEANKALDEANKDNPDWKPLYVDKYLYNFTNIHWQSYFGNGDGTGSPLVLRSTKTFGGDIASQVMLDSLYKSSIYRRVCTLLNDFKRAGSPAYDESDSCFFLDTEERLGYKAPAKKIADNEESFAVAMVSGDMTLDKYYSSEDYYVVRTDAPVFGNQMFSSMFAVSTFSTTALDGNGLYMKKKIANYDDQVNPRSFELITALETDADIVNLLTYGVSGIHYDLASNGTVNHPGKTTSVKTADGSKVDSRYVPIIGKAGNLFLTRQNSDMTPEELYYSAENWSAAKTQNQRAVFSPYCGFILHDIYEMEGVMTANEIKAEFDRIYKENDELIKNYEGDDIGAFISSLNSAFTKTDAYKYATMRAKMNEETGDLEYLSLPFNQYVLFFYLLKEGSAGYGA